MTCYIGRLIIVNNQGTIVFGNANILPAATGSSNSNTETGNAAGAGSGENAARNNSVNNNGQDNGKRNKRTTNMG